MTKYFFVAASEKFLTVEEPLEEILKERERNYKENNKDKDFWLLKNPSFKVKALIKKRGFHPSMLDRLSIKKN